MPRQLAVGRKAQFALGALEGHRCSPPGGLNHRTGPAVSVEENASPGWVRWSVSVPDVGFTVLEDTCSRWGPGATRRGCRLVLPVQEPPAHTRGVETTGLR